MVVNRCILQPKGNIYSNTAAVAQYESQLAAPPWALCHIERIYIRPGITDRRLITLEGGSRAAMHAALVQRGLRSACHSPKHPTT